MSQSPYVTSVFREAVQGVVGGSLCWLLTCTLAGAIVTGAAAGRIDNIDWAWALAWIGHLAAAGMWIWGLLVLCVHAGCLAALVNGTDRVLRVVVFAFLVQLTTSAIVVASLEDDAMWRVMIAWLVGAAPAIVFLIRNFRKQAHE